MGFDIGSIENATGLNGMQFNHICAMEKEIILIPMHSKKKKVSNFYTFFYNDFRSKFSDEFIDSSIFSLIEKMAPTFDDTMIICELFNPVDCKKFLSPIYTKIGLCYTFNFKDLNDIPTDE